MRNKFKLCDPMPKTFAPKEEEDDGEEYYYEDENTDGGAPPGGSGGGEDEYYTGEKNIPNTNQGGGFRPPMTGMQQPSGFQ
jgi:hypothetical protein